MIVIIAGSERDAETYKEIARNLEKFLVPFKVHIASAHKTPEYLLKILDSYEKKQNPLIYICVAGRSNNRSLSGYQLSAEKRSFCRIGYSFKSENALGYRGFDCLGSRSGFPCRG
ncbi:MAG: N5-carboxyaminoimidazole ribonucleotide mutase [Candidatus Gottesmanbacteria bacterium GW2011_GWC2_42_8]|nr:MAG: N5-carboxyaminoimidazole ribonucleotide mutase [Candidatus Gottesmanbacteria bacterium GW2011_GWC2_42_8]